MRAFCRHFGWELRKLFARPRTWLGFGVFLVSEFVLLLLLRFPAVRGAIRRDMLRAGATFEGNFSGLTVADYLMSNTMSSLGILFIALVAADIVAKEIDDGTLRSIFCRPVSRGGLLAQKYLVIVLYSAVAVAFIAASALGLGLLFEGPGNVFFWSFKEDVMAWFPFREGLLRYLIALPWLTLTVVTVATVAFVFSCFDMKPATTTALTLAIFLADDMIRHVPQFRPAREYLISTRTIAWIHVYDPIIPWPFLRRNYAILVAADAALLAIAYGGFRRRDFKP